MLLGNGIDYLKILFNKKSFWISYILCFGLFDVASALYQTNNPSESSGLLFLQLLVSAFLTLFFVVFLLLILTGKKVFSRRLIGNVWRVWLTEVNAGIYITLGLFCFIIPGILLSIRYIYAGEIALIEGSYISQTLKKSRQLSSINGGVVILSCILAFLLYFCSAFTLTILVGLISQEGLNSFAMNYFNAIYTNLLSILWCTIVYSGYLDATALNSSNELKLSEE